MTRARCYSAILFVAVVAATACDFQRKTTTTGGGGTILEPSAAIPSLVGTWSTAASTSPAGSCSDVTWTVTSQTATDVTGSFTAVCLGSANIVGTGSGHITGSNVVLTVSGNGTMPGLPTCPFSLTGTGAIDGEIIRVPYTGTTCLGPLSGTQTLKRSLIQPPVIAPAPTPAPTPTPTPTPTPVPPPSGPNDDLDLRTVTILGSTSIANWPVTSTLTSAHHTGSDLCTAHTMAGRWPVLPFFDDPATVEGNQWMFAFINGRWYGAAGEWLRPGQTCKDAGGNLGQGSFYNTPPMASWTPVPGELIGLAVSTPARAGQWGTAERSNVVLIRW